MKIGLSLYSLSKLINSGEMDVEDAIRWIADNGGQHVEISPGKLCLKDKPELIEKIKNTASEVHIDISSYTIGANFLTDTEEDFYNEIKRVKEEVDIAHALGVKFMRHDAGTRPKECTSVAQYEADFPSLVKACSEIADYAAQYGITTSVENHGYHVQGSERVHRLVNAVNKDNFKTTLDVGNFLCVDEDPLAAVKNNISIASFIHMKDFYIRDTDFGPREGWFQTKSGRYLRGAIIGHGDIKLPDIASIIKASGYNGYISIEFEGMENCKLGSKLGMQYVKKLFS